MAPEGEPTFRVACFATQGSGSGDEARIQWLLSALQPTVVGFERGRRITGAFGLIRALSRARPDLLVMEGTGVAGGAVVLLMRSIFGTPYVVSSGDAVAPFLRAVRRPLGILGLLYEWALYRASSGFIGWSPYLVGRALTFGAPRAMTAPHWASADGRADGAAIRRRLGIAPDAIVFGIVGSLNWTARYEYCYGVELVRAISRISRPDVCVLVVGDGSGRERLREMAGDRLGKTVFLPGPVARQEVSSYLDAIDVASLPQSVDGVGAFRYTTKISEYLAADLPIVTGQIPLAYDIAGGWSWRLPGDAPWDERYLRALAALMMSLSPDDAAARRPGSRHADLFDAARQRDQVTQFVADVVERSRSGL
jgi:glycosyltransferase involved in cell wall biosynthesis